MKNITSRVLIKALEGEFSDLGECPLWNPSSQELWYMDCRNGRIIRRAKSGFEKVYSVPSPAGSFSFNGDGELIVALKNEICVFDIESERPIVLKKVPESNENIRLNDGVSLPDGSFIVGTMHVDRRADEEAQGGLYRLDKSGGIEKIWDAFGVANGPNFNQLDGRFYICDSSKRKIYSFEITNGSLSDQADFVDTSELGSAPDGCKFDSEGGMWVALVHAGCIVRYDSRGTLTHRIDLPLSHPSSLCFGGVDLDIIYVTSIRDSGRLRADGPNDGLTLEVKYAGFKGLPANFSNIEVS